MSKSLRLTCLLLALALVPAAAHAQLSIYRPNTPATGESYSLELSYGIWNPTPGITLSSDSLALLGTQIDAVNDLGFTTTKFRDLQIGVKVATKHKVRFEYLPIRYAANGFPLTRSLTFKGITYSAQLPVTSSLNWKSYRFGYEYDFVSRNRGFLGIIGELKYIDAEASVASVANPLVNLSASTHQKAPIPTIGGIARGYIAENVSFTGELTAFKLPSSTTSDRRGRYVDYDLYGTINFSNYAGAQAGYRSVDAMYAVTGDAGNVKLKGLYLKGIVRF